MPKLDDAPSPVAPDDSTDRVSTRSRRPGVPGRHARPIPIAGPEPGRRRVFGTRSNSGVTAAVDGPDRPRQGSDESRIRTGKKPA